MNKPIVSVIMPVYNAEKYLNEAIESILNQTFKDFEFIIVNDGSTDNSLNIIEKYKNQDDRIKVINRENRGLIYSLNEAIMKSSGIYIARMDSDDISLPTRFEEQVNILEQNKEVEVVGCHYNIIDNSGNIRKQHRVPLSTEDIFFNLFYSTPFAHPSVMIKKEILINNLYSDNIETSAVEDYELWTRIYNKNNFFNIDKCLFSYRIYGESFSDTKKKKMYKSGMIVSKHFFKKNYNYLKELLKNKYASEYFFRMLSILFNSNISKKLFFLYLIRNLNQIDKMAYFVFREFARYCYYNFWTK
jgi:glycosyltransferase involved in cell wall biosynthesis